MLIKDLTFLKDSQPFAIDNGGQKRIDLVLIKLPQPQRPKKIRPSFFFMNTCQEIFSMRHTKAGQYKKCFDCLVSCGGNPLQREMICYGKCRPPRKVEIFFDKAIYGTAQNPITNIPIFNVNILLYPLECSKPLVSTISNATGDYLIEGVPASIYRITASKLGYYTFRAKFTIASNQQFRAINIPLLPKYNPTNSQANRMENQFDDHGPFFAEMFQRA